MKPKTWIDVRLFSFSDVVRLTGYAPSRIHGYIARKQFRPQFTQPHGGARGTDGNVTYTARDILRLHLLGPAVQFGVHVSAGDRYGSRPHALLTLTHALDLHLDAIAAGETASGDGPMVFPRQFAPWCYLVLDLPRLATIQYRRIEEYRKLRARGIEPGKAARDSLLIAVKPTQNASKRAINR